MQFALAQLDASVIEEVSLVLWKELFDAVGWPASLEGKRETFNHADILQAFNSDTPTDELLQALEALEDLGTESGRDAIVSAMNDCSVSAATLPTSTGEREFALRLFLAQRSDVSMADVFARAQTQAQEGADHRRYNEFLGKAAKPVSNLKKRSDALRLDVLGHCRENGLGEHVDVRAFENNGTYFFHVIRSHHMKTPLAVVPGHDARTKIHYRPVHGDILRYDSFTGRLRIAARVASIVEFYRRILGQILFNDGEFFSGEPLCNLRVLQDRGLSAGEPRYSEHRPRMDDRMHLGTRPPESSPYPVCRLFSRH